MATDSVIERAKQWIRRFDDGGPFPGDGRDAEPIIRNLIALIEQTQRDWIRDLARLDWMLINDARLVWSVRDKKHYAVKAGGDVVGVGASSKKRAIDSALEEENQNGDR